MVTKQIVDEFIKQKKWAFVGVSQNKKKFGHFAYKELKSKGYEIFPVNPNLESIEGKTAYPSLNDLPERVEAVVISVSPSKTAQIVREAHLQGIKHIWMQQGAETEEAINFCRDNEINCVHGECILMFANPVGFPHSAHRFIWKLLGKLPK